MLGEIFIATKLDFLILLPLSGVMGAPGKVEGGTGKEAVRVLKPGPSSDFIVEGSNSDIGFCSTTFDCDCCDCRD